MLQPYPDAPLKIGDVVTHRTRRWIGHVVHHLHHPRGAVIVRWSAGAHAASTPEVAESLELVKDEVSPAE
jgi:hypothetical protein